MTKKSQEKGQALILIALAAVGLFAFAALAIDGSMVFSDKRHAQNAADTAVMAAALAKIRGVDYTTAALNRATSNGYDNNGSSNIVEVHYPPASGQYIGNSEYIQVIITSHVNMTFARVIGRTQMTNVVEAVARVQGSFATPLYNGSAMVALRQSGCGICGNGNLSLDINGSGAFSNSTSNCSMNYVGNANLTVDTAFTIATGGTACETGNITLNGPLQAGAQVPYPPSNLVIPAPTFTCTGTGSVTGNTINPGTFTSSLDLNGNANYEFATGGSFCFDDGATINGNINLTANNIQIRINGGSFQINGNSTFTCTNMLVYGAGGSGMHFNGNGSNSCTGVTFYMGSGSVTWNGNVANTFTAPTSGTYKGLLIYMPHGNPSGLTINGNAGNQLTGSIIAISSSVAINGNSGTTGLRTQIIGYDIALSGNSNTTINFDPDDQYIPPAAPTIELAE